MPIMTCELNGNPGYKYGPSGKCYTYRTGSETSRKAAKKRAILQGVVIGGWKIRHDAVVPEPPFITALKSQGLTDNRIRSRLRRKPKRLIVPRTVEREYEKFLRGLVNSWRDIYLHTVDPILESLAAEASVLKPTAAQNIRTDQWPDRLAEIITTYEKRVTETLAPVDPKTLEVGYNVSSLNLAAWKRVVRSVVGIDLFVREPWLEEQLNSFRRQNISLITRTAAEAKSEVERVITSGLQQGKRVETLRKEILSETNLEKGVFKKLSTRAALIARDQMAKLNGQLSQLRQNELGLDRYFWRTVMDERVRDSHLAINGYLCRWDDSTVYSDDGGKTWKSRDNLGAVTLHPGQDYQCRCYPEADFTSILD